MYDEFGKKYTEDEMIFRAWDKEVIHDLIGRLVLYWGNGERRRAVDELWVRTAANQETASFATNTGFYVGINEVARHLVLEYEEKKYASLETFTTASSGVYTNKDLGMGMTAMHSCTTPVLFIANNGLTARYLCYDLGMSGKGKPNGTADCYFEFGLLLIELIKEEDEWKIWHLVEEHDFSIESGKDYNEVPTVITDTNDPASKDFGDPTIKKDVYDNQYGWEYLYEDWPVPYKHYDEDYGYGPNGIVGKKYYERLMRG